MCSTQTVKKYKTFSTKPLYFFILQQQINRQSPIFSLVTKNIFQLTQCKYQPYTLVGSLEDTPLAVKLLENRLYIYLLTGRGMCITLCSDQGMWMTLCNGRNQCLFGVSTFGESPFGKKMWYPSLPQGAASQGRHPNFIYTHSFSQKLKGQQNSSCSGNILSSLNGEYQ